MVIPKTLNPKHGSETNYKLELIKFETVLSLCF